MRSGMIRFCVVAGACLLLGTGAYAKKHQAWETQLGDSATTIFNHSSSSDQMLEAGKDCLAALEAATASGLTDESNVHLRGFYGEFPGSREKKGVVVAPLATVRNQVCRYPNIDAVATAAKKCLSWREDIRKDPSAYNRAGEVMRVDVRDCNKSVDDALAAGIPAETPILCGEKEIPLGEVKVKACEVLAKAAKREQKKGDAARDAKLAPFLAVLSDDKLAVFTKWQCTLPVNCFGPGGVEMTTPEQFVKADAWFMWGVNRDALGPRWSLSGYRFRGMKRDGDLFRRGGKGDEPPSSAFR
ncbi:MAG: hypothetical protein NTY77_18935 [Elusimicrobia bacterium]|nr:hypothetical protein [Elusimicrobiota bacterium]